MTAVTYSVLLCVLVWISLVGVHFPVDRTIMLFVLCCQWQHLCNVVIDQFCWLVDICVWSICCDWWLF